MKALRIVGCLSRHRKSVLTLRSPILRHFSRSNHIFTQHKSDPNQQASNFVTNISTTPIIDNVKKEMQKDGPEMGFLKNMLDKHQGSMEWIRFVKQFQFPWWAKPAFLLLILIFGYEELKNRTNLGKLLKQWKTSKWLGEDPLDLESCENSTIKAYGRVHSLSTKACTEKPDMDSFKKRSSIPSVPHPRMQKDILIYHLFIRKTEREGKSRKTEDYEVIFKVQDGFQICVNPNGNVTPEGRTEFEKNWWQPVKESDGTNYNVKMCDKFVAEVDGWHKLDANELSSLLQTERVVTLYNASDVQQILENVNSFAKSNGMNKLYESENEFGVLNSHFQITERVLRSGDAVTVLGRVDEQNRTFSCNFISNSNELAVVKRLKEKNSIGTVGVTCLALGGVMLLMV